MITLLWFALGVAAGLVIWFLARWHARLDIDAAFTAGHKFGRASVFLSQAQIDQELIRAGIDPSRLPGR